MASLSVEHQTNQSNFWWIHTHLGQICERVEPIDNHLAQSVDDGRDNTVDVRLELAVVGRVDVITKELEGFELVTSALVSDFFQVLEESLGAFPDLLARN